ncbi:wax ester/triacylglycerol synthase family O-acyltransferase [Rhodococcus sp. IEGM 1379]|uniref:wax ester/triacylglycerol synthase family O-acyltransferase n=1 Tax=Rhodococcus sp. IEGM 1379 TaxID=3047086 RepID=UPI0024B799F0|nr:wax ester/triacylglycerol synthase family O-acyltransferase [Rhodococcus sp. IEGM 1379]MDI9914462.1 wax ester/triacylglycerol synthase family O-acyltransferase [Rhodococcus sp. IEGM 1379]
MPEKLTPLDAAFLEIEDSDRHASLAIGAVMVAEGPAPTDHDLIERLNSRIRSLPHAADLIHTVPFDLAAPTWVADANFDPARHFTRVGVPTPGRMQDVTETVAWIMSERLDRDRPLWQCWLIEGLEDNRWAILIKAHHSLMDGITGARLFDVMFDAPPSSSSPTEKAAPAEPESLYGRIVGAYCSVLETPQRLARRSVRIVEGTAQLAGDLLIPSANTSLNGSIGRQRRYGAAQVRMHDVRTICSTFDVTVNDVALACVTSSLRSLLLHRNEDPSRNAVRTLVPVSVRSSNNGTSPHNEVSLMLPFLPVDTEDPLDRLQLIHRRLSRHKRGGESGSGQSITAAAQYAPFMSSAWFVRLAMRVPQRSIVTVVTDIPGPTDKRRLMGRDIVSIYPYVPIAVRLRLGFAILSYHDQLTFGITADYDSVSEIDLLSQSLEQEVDVLLRSTRTPSPLAEPH